MAKDIERIGCEYCIPTRKANDAWAKQPIVDKMLISSNINGTFPVDNTKRHEGVSVKVKDYGGGLSDNDDPGYLNHVKLHPAAIEIQSHTLGEKAWPSVLGEYVSPVIIEIEIRYCPFCGRRLGVL